MTSAGPLIGRGLLSTARSCIDFSAISRKRSLPTPTSPSRPGRPSVLTRPATRSAAGESGLPNASLTRFWRSALAGRFQRSTEGSITHDVWPCGTWQAAPSTWPMPWLAPTPTPDVPAPIDSNRRSCRSGRVLRSSDVALCAGRARASNLRASVDVPMAKGLACCEHRRSTAWSTALTPVDSMRSIGVASVAAGSSTITRGTIRRWPKLSLMPLRGSLTPAKALNSAARQRRWHGDHAHRVGGRLDRLRGRRRALPGPAGAIEVEIVDRRRSLPQRDQHHFGGVDHRAAAHRHDQISLGLARQRRAFDDAGPRRVRRDAGIDPGVAVAQLADDLGPDRALRHRFRGRHEHAMRAQPLSLGPERGPCRLAVDDALDLLVAVDAAQHGSILLAWSITDANQEE